MGKGAALLLSGLAIVGGYVAVSSFPYNIRYMLPALLGVLAMITLLALKRYAARVSLFAILAVALWADAQWFYSPVYRKEDLRAVAQWMIQNHSRVKSWTIVPAYSNEPLRWYLEALGHPEVLAHYQPAQPTLLSPTQEVVIKGRRATFYRPRN